MDNDSRQRDLINSVWRKALNRAREQDLAVTVHLRNREQFTGRVNADINNGDVAVRIREDGEVVAPGLVRRDTFNTVALDEIVAVSVR